MADNGLELGAAYVSDQLRAVTAEVGKPRRLIHVHEEEEEYYYVAIASVSGLDAALAESEINAGCLVGHVLPTATLSDCLRLKDAAEDGWYRGLCFLLVATEEGEDAVDAKLGTILAVVEARLDLEEARATLAALEETLRKTGRVLQQLGDRPQITPGARTRAILGDEEWARHIDKARMDVMAVIAFAVERLRPGQARLESI